MSRNPYDDLPQLPAFDLRSAGPLGERKTLYAGVHDDRYVLDTGVRNASNWLGDADGMPVSAFAGRTSTRAAYLQDVWGFAPAWALTLGGRLEQWRRKVGRRGGTCRWRKADGRSGRGFRNQCGRHRRGPVSEQLRRHRPQRRRHQQAGEGKRQPPSPPRFHTVVAPDRHAAVLDVKRGKFKPLLAAAFRSSCFADK